MRLARWPSQRVEVHLAHTNGKDQDAPRPRPLQPPACRCQDAHGPRSLTRATFSLRPGPLCFREGDVQGRTSGWPALSWCPWTDAHPLDDTLRLGLPLEGLEGELLVLYRAARWSRPTRVTSGPMSIYGMSTMNSLTFVGSGC